MIGCYLYIYTQAAGRDVNCIFDLFYLIFFCFLCSTNFETEFVCNKILKKIKYPHLIPI